MLRVLSPVAATLVFATALGAAPGNSTPDSRKGTPGQIQEHKPTRTRKPEVGKASWYGRVFQSHKTASGEPFDMYQFTAAHRTLPLGSWVKVTDLKTDRSVVVRINDRGPVARGRIIDLSYGAAKMLAMKGVDRVRLEVLQTPEVAENLGLQE
ncbi:MAG TPA: septal ring lytic transglycosylase RlpA family protein [Terriglobales bacterium]|jgi:rare lipoprotein A|nr:septal ring lytic transglycosylase RlpA family protein [Terriglobales bacterium]